MVSNNVEFLKDAGPTPSDELPFTQKRADKIDGLRVFKLHERADGSNVRGGQQTHIAYLDQHDDEEIVRTFIEANTHLVENNDKPGLVSVFRNVGAKWSDVASDVLEVYFDEEEHARAPCGPDEGATDTCPFCGSGVAKGGLPNHVAGECEEQ